MQSDVRSLKKGLFDVPVSVITRERTVNKVISAAKQSSLLTVAFINVHSIMVAQEDSGHKEALSRFDITAPDGQPIRWALNYFHKSELTERVYGPDVTLDVCSEAEKENLSLYFYGSTDNVLQKLQQNLIKLFPDLTISGVYSPPFHQGNQKDISEYAQKIRNSNADILFVGLGCPKQEHFVNQISSELKIPILAVGAAFDFHAGTIGQAPRWMQKQGLEWVFRFFKEPHRLFKRYFYYNNWFIWLAIKETLKKKASK